MKRYKIPNYILVALVFSATLSLSGCSLNTVIDDLKDPDQLSTELHQKPRFWYDSLPLSEKNGLHTLANEFFQRKPYNNIASFGDNVLLVGQGTYIENSEEFEYSFDLYNPWKNSIVASINHEDTHCNSYQIVGNNLFLINTNNSTIDIYDNNLSFSEHIDLGELGDITDFSFYPATDENHLLFYNYTDRTLSQIDKHSLEVSLYDFDMYNSSVIAVSDDGQELLVSGLNENTLHYEIQSIDTSTRQTTNTIRGVSNYPADVSEDYVITSVDSTWIYHDKKTDSNLSFVADDVTNTTLLPDGSFILNSETNWEEENGSHTNSYCHVSKDGQLLSSFTFDCGDPSQPGYVYFSTDFAYLPEANCIMFLNYTTDVNPYILVWDLNVLTDDNALNLKLVDNSKSDNDSSKEVNFGALEDANKRACQLEDKYGINIYLGDEVPTAIDVFNTAPLYDPSIVSESLNRLTDILSCYPDNFFSQLCYGELESVEIYLAGDITSESEDTVSAAGGFVTVEDTRIIMVLDSNGSQYWNYTVHHELSHMIDRRLDFRILFEKNSIYSDEKWSEYNPEDFEYLNSYSGYAENPAYISNMDYFVDDYGTTFPTEDRAEIFGKAMEDYMNDVTDTAFFQDKSPIKKKLSYYSQAIREGFDTTGWPDKMPWEVMLAK